MILPNIEILLAVTAVLRKHVLFFMEHPLILQQVFDLEPGLVLLLFDMKALDWKPTVLISAAT